MGIPETVQKTMNTFLKPHNERQGYNSSAFTEKGLGACTTLGKHPEVQDSAQTVKLLKSTTGVGKLITDVQGNPK